jgi:molecular chaperone DnaK (HSP70)
VSKLYSVGIDLGTSNSAMASASPGWAPEIIPITQLAAPAVLEERALLPSAAYIPSPDEFPASTLRLPWSGGEEQLIIGAFARSHGALVPERLIVSAKSWLCNAHIDRKSRILPWKSEVVADKRSPFEVAALFLEHMRRNFELYCRSSRRLSEPEHANIVLTVPASFDEAARSLTPRRPAGAK